VVGSIRVSRNNYFLFRVRVVCLCVEYSIDSWDVKNGNVTLKKERLLWVNRYRSFSLHLGMFG